MSEKISLEFIKNKFKERGYELLSNDYKNNKSKLIFKDKDGYIYCQSYNGFSSGSEPLKWNKFNPYSIQNIENYLRINNINLEILSDKYINSKSKLLFKCSCEEKFEVSMGAILWEGKTMCNKCSGKEKWTIEKINKYIEEHNIEVELLSTEIKNLDEPLIWRCKCGNIYNCSIHHFIGANQYRCLSCSRTQSKYEYLIEEYLKENKINYRTEYKFEDCKNVRSLPFDFAIFDENGNIMFLIEADGEQHYTSEYYTTFNNKEERLEKLKKRQRLDNIKTQYCNDNNIKLIRIPYWEFKNGNYLNILKEYL